MTNSYALIENNLVTNVIVWDGDSEAWQPPEGVTARLLEAGDVASIGYSFDGEAFAPPPAPPAPPAPAPAVPSQVTMRQARLALLAAGKLTAVDAAIAALQSPKREAAQIEWDYSSTVERNSAIVALLGPALELDGEALDALFTAAAKL
ncbi:hypothetical protein SAMN05518669_103340 [Variovorax sp. YR634]|uniref:hypothetical protein n=1 Tax=Variovorax sp. YR634 TaxID=1884385 RepID=UPI0008971282|nr:hypothetical protein [Variovorax sp. YR634]SDX12190.1 hypothetical protein SAMN05518669_103340 [Variovorax sp. YR634]